MSVVEPLPDFHGFQYGSYLLKLLTKHGFRENQLSIVFLLAVLNTVTNRISACSDAEK